MEHSQIKPIKSISGREIVLPKISTESFTAYENYNLPFEEYITKKEFMNSSAVNRILHKSPFYFLQEWCGLLEEDDEEYFKFGRAVHMALLEPKKFKESFMIAPKFGRSKADKDFKKKFFEENSEAVILKEKEYEDLMGIISTIQEEKQLFDIFTDSVTEQTIFWRESTTGVHCKSRLDIVYDQKLNDEYYLQIFDVKTTVDGSPDKFKWSIENYGYLVQLAFYKEALEQSTGRSVHAVHIIAIEKKFPYDFYIHTLSDEDLQRGKNEFLKGLEIYKKCRLMDKWPRRQKGASMITLPYSHYPKQIPDFDFDN